MNDTPLLTTKLFPPPVQPGSVPRARLTTRLNQGLSGKLTLVCAPAGFGKTILLGEWRAQVPVGQSRWLWLSLDPDDDQPNRFWAYIATALEAVDPELREMARALLQAGTGIALQAVVAELINRVVSLDGRIVLCLDDYHFIHNQSIHDSLAYFLDHLPPRLHLVIASRTTPPLPLPRLRGRGQLNELGADDLRFTAKESSEYLNTVMGLDLSPTQVDRLERRTEGWIVGLQMAALSLKDRTDVDDFVSAFSGSHRYIADYLLDEVLASCTPDVHKFLLQTGILTRICGSLCDAVTGRTDSQAMILGLEASNLFVIPLDDERRWYRYHHLFGQLLLERLLSTQPGQATALHLRAANWHAANGFIGPAMEHALAAEAFDVAASIVDEFVRFRGHIAANIAWANQGDYFHLIERLKELDEDTFYRYPYACIFHIYIRYANQLLLDQPALDQLLVIEQRLQSGQYDDMMCSEQREHLLGAINAIRVYIYALNGDVDLVREFAARAQAFLSEEDLATHLTVKAIAASTELVVEGDALGTERSLESTASLADLHIYIPGMWAIIQWNRGHLHRSADTCRQAHALHLEGSLTWYGKLGLLQGAIYYEWNQLELALDTIRRATRASTTAVSAENQACYYSTLAPVYSALERTEEAAAAYQKLPELATKVKDVPANLFSPSSRTLRAWHAGYLLRLGEIAPAVAWAETVDQSAVDRLSYIHLIEHLTLVRVYLAQDRIGEALGLLARLRQRAEEQGRNRHLIEILGLEAMGHMARNETTQALASLHQALTLAEPEGYIRTFVDMGLPMAQLLQTAATQGSHADYIRTLLDAFHQEPSAALPIPFPSAGGVPLFEPLSEREIEVLKLAADGLSNRAIAQELHITVGTVKSHLNTVFSKLNVHSRTQAAVRARDLHIL